MLQESCEFFIKHNAQPKHKKKHHRSGSHKLKVLSKSMGTSTGAKANHGVSTMAITSHDFLEKEATMTVRSAGEASQREDQESASSIVKPKVEQPAEETAQTLPDNCQLLTPPEEQSPLTSSVRGNGLSGSIHRLVEGR